MFVTSPQKTLMLCQAVYIFGRRLKQGYLGRRSQCVAVGPGVTNLRDVLCPLWHHRGLSYRTICVLETQIIHWDPSYTATLYPSGPVLALYVLPANHVKNCSTASACTGSSRKTLCRQRAKLIILLFANKMLGCWPFLNKRKTSFRVCVRQSFFNESSHTPFH